MPDLDFSRLDELIRPTAGSSDEAAVLVVRWVQAANDLVGLPDEDRPTFSWRVIFSAEPAVGYLVGGNVEQARDYLAHVYLSFYRMPRTQVTLWSYDDALDHAFHNLFGPPMGDVLRELRRGWNLSYGELARLFGVSDETVRRWATGVSEPSPRALPMLRELHDTSRRLARFFRPERLAEVLRRPAELFNGETALEWILRGAAREVADRYDAVLSYQQ